jgi:hypothetical protein
VTIGCSALARALSEGCQLQAGFGAVKPSSSHVQLSSADRGICHALSLALRSAPPLLQVVIWVR